MTFRWIHEFTRIIYTSVFHFIISQHQAHTSKVQTPLQPFQPSTTERVRSHLWCAEHLRAERPEALQPGFHCIQFFEVHRMISFRFSAIFTLCFNAKNPVIEFSIPEQHQIFFCSHHYPQQYQVITIGSNISFLRFRQESIIVIFTCQQEQFDRLTRKLPDPLPAFLRTTCFILHSFLQKRRGIFESTYYIIINYKIFIPHSFLQTGRFILHSFLQVAREDPFDAPHYKCVLTDED